MPNCFSRLWSIFVYICSSYLSFLMRYGMSFPIILRTKNMGTGVLDGKNSALRTDGTVLCGWSSLSNSPSDTNIGCMFFCVWLIYKLHSSGVLGPCAVINKHASFLFSSGVFASSSKNHGMCFSIKFCSIFCVFPLVVSIVSFAK